MKGYEVRTAMNPWTGYFFRFFKNKDEAESYAKKEQIGKQLVKIVECDLEWCPNCQDRLMHAEDHECSFCDHLRCDL